MLSDFSPEKIVTFVGRITAKRFAMAKLLDRAMHGIDDRTRQRLGDVADPATDQTLRRFGIRVTKFANAPRDLGEKIAGLKLEIVVV